MKVRTILEMRLSTMDCTIGVRAMPWYDVIWNEEPGGNVEHIAEHGLTRDDIEAVLRDPIATTRSRSSGRPVATGYTDDGRLILVVYEEVDESTIYPVTAYEIEP